MQISKIGSDAVSLGWWSCAALSRLKGMDGETRGDDSRKTRNCKIKPRMGLGMHWGKRKKSQSFTFWGILCLFTSRRRESRATAGVLNGKNHGREFGSWQEKTKGEMLDLKAVSCYRGLKFTLAMNKSVFEAPPCG